MSNIAVVIESKSSAMTGTETRQTVMFQYENNPVIFTRVTDGKQGLGNRWEKVNQETLIASMHDDEYMYKEVTGVEVTLSDYSKYKDTDRIQVLGVKSVSALLKSKAASDNQSAAMVAVTWHHAVEQNLPELTTLVPKLASAQMATPQQTNQQPTGVMVKHTNTIQVSLASVPRAEIGTRYVNRKVIGGYYDFELFDYARENNINFLFEGPTGCAKTTSVEAYAAIRGLRLATVSGSAALEPSQLIGKYVSDGEGGFAWIDGPVTDVVRNGGILLLDELNFINMKIITPLYSLLDARRSLTLLDHHGETIQAHPDLMIFATMNPNYIGTSPLNFAFRNRFAIQLQWDYDYDVEGKLVTSASLLELARKLRGDSDRGLYETPIATNMLMEFERFASSLNFDFAKENFIARFNSEEQASVRVVFQLFDENIKSDLGLLEESDKIVTEHEPEKTVQYYF